MVTAVTTGVTAVLVVAIALVAARPLLAGDVLVFAAASTTEALEAAAAQFSRGGEDRVRGVFAGSSLLAKQIDNGAPADIYLSASSAWMDYLGQRGRIDKASRRDLLANSLVVIAPGDGTHIDVVEFEVDIVARLGDGRLAMGDPDHVPAGIYARQALASLGLWPALEDRLIRTNDVRVALRMVARGEAPLGIVYASDAVAFAGVRVAGMIPETGHDPIRYPVALVVGNDNPAARRFLDFL
ncbi:MAG: molybdate ABC transporter substrate-binding protein, partial [Rhodospirillaceae bacterium]|nr:molybdate ABC transporter substrate-binding protein [Rhodospirillaceae bacterium]